MSIKYKSFQFECKSVSEAGIFEGYLSVFGNVDSYGDVVLKGAFEKTIAAYKAKGKMPPVLWQHNSRDPIGVFTSMEEDDYGLKVTGELLVDDIPLAKQAMALLAKKAIDGMSIGYYLTDYEYSKTDAVCFLKEIELIEGSIVTFAANELATVTGIKQFNHDALPSLKEFEKFLSDSGFSKAQATKIASHGLRQLIQGDPESETMAKNELLDLIKNK